ncbi:alpha/beta hydrolase, partial [Streptococcus pyogenes]|uniref:alpha/beta hydrolase n=1 Tax=Streptococcus pyogenes TaxID=1314 RepID=UPI003DA15BAE
YFTYAPNFRGVGRSEGQYDHGQGERADVLALIEVVKNRHSNLPLILAGFSFGAYIALHVAQSQLCSHLILLSLAVGIYKIPAPLIPAG